MDTKRTHPLLIAASIAVILACGVGIAAMLGVLPKGQASNADQTAAMQTTAEQAAADKKAAEKESVKKAAVEHHKTVASESSKQQVASVCHDCGKIVDVKAVKVEGNGSGLGAVAGGVAGGAIGNQMGAGNGRTAMTLLGAVGGAVLGNKIEKNYKAATIYEVEVAFDDGTHNQYKFQEKPYWQVGDRVKVVNGKITAM